MKREELLEEHMHFEECRKIILYNIKKYEMLLDKLKVEIQSLYKAVQGGDAELYDQLITSMSLEKVTKNQLRKNLMANEKPYFGRIDFINIEEDKVESIYIGKNGVLNNTEVVIVDWRAPVANVYYENEIGRGDYELPSGDRHEIDLQLKRTYNIENRKLAGYYDSDVISNDELLVKYLSKNKDAVFGDIISTIQKEQNEIIRSNPFQNIIVQGVAGSGKTTVAMHRISYILYNYSERFTSNEFCVIGSNDILLNYITSGLPELDVPDVKQKRMDEMLIYLLGNEWKRKYILQTIPEQQSWKSKMDFMEKLEVFLQEIRIKSIYGSSIYDNELGQLMSEENNREFIEQYPHISLNNLLVLLDERLQSRISLFVDCQEVNQLKRKKMQYRKHFSAKKVKEKVVDIYHKFLGDFAKQKDVKIEELLQSIMKGIFDVYDLAAMLVIYYRIFQKEKDGEFGQIFIDEAQDYGPTLYYAMKLVLPKCFFTIMGDVSQNINYRTGMNDWNAICQKVFSKESDRFKVLSKSYRNTIEISEYAGKVLEYASNGLYKIQPVIRHGSPVNFVQVSEFHDGINKLHQITENIKAKGYDTVAVICFNDEEQQHLENSIQNKIMFEKDRNKFKKGIMILPIELIKGLEFDTVILWNPDLTRYKENPKLAKSIYVAITRALHELHIISF